MRAKPRTPSPPPSMRRRCLRLHQQHRADTEAEDDDDAAVTDLVSAGLPNLAAALRRARKKQKIAAALDPDATANAAELCDSQPLSEDSHPGPWF